MAKPETEISKLKNLGKVSQSWLNEVGIYTMADLAEVGPIRAYALVKARGHNATLNLVYGIQATLMDLHWTDLPPALRDELKAQVAALRKSG